MAASLGGLLPGICAVLMVLAVASAASSEEASSVVVGLAKCADCTRKNLKAETAFNGLEVAIKCKNSKGEYESKATGKLDGSGAFSVPLSKDLHDADCVAQLHSAAGTPCPGQEPSRIVPQLSEGNTEFVVVPGKTDYPSAECASATLFGPIKKHLLDHFHKKPVPPKPKPKPEPKPQPEPTPTYGSPTPIYHPPSTQVDKKHIFDHFYKDHDYHKFFDHFHKKPVPPKPKPEPKPKPQPESPTPTYGSPTPIYHPPARHLFDKKPLLDHFHKDHDYHKFFDHFHKKPVPPKPKPEPKPQPEPENHPPTPTYGSPTPIYHPPTEKDISFDKKHVLDHFHKDHDYHHFFDYFHKKPVPPKPKPEPKPQPKPENQPPTPTYGSPTPIYHPPAEKDILFDKKDILDHFNKDHDYHHFFDYFHKKPVPPKPKPEPKPQPKPEYQPPTPTYGSPTPIYHPPAEKGMSIDKKHFLDHFHKDHDYHHFFDHFHKKPVPPKPKPEPKPQPEPSPTPTYGSPTPIYHPPAKH